MLCVKVVSLLIGASLVTAAAVPEPVFKASSMRPRTLQADDIVLYGANGRTEVMKKAAYEALLSNNTSPYGPLAPTPQHQPNWTTSGNWTQTNGTAPTPISERCSKETVVTVDDTTSFLNWDVPMSSVLHTTVSTGTIAVTDGYSIANSIGVSVGASLTIVKDFLTETFSIDYTQTWTSTYTVAYTYQVPANTYAVVVSNPQTTRRTGHVNIGCIGEKVDTTTFTADNYESKSANGLAWVTGTIGMCTSDKYPIPMCIGSGTLS